MSAGAVAVDETIRLPGRSAPDMSARLARALEASGEYRLARVGPQTLRLVRSVGGGGPLSFLLRRSETCTVTMVDGPTAAVVTVHGKLLPAWLDMLRAGRFDVMAGAPATGTDEPVVVPLAPVERAAPPGPPQPIESKSVIPPPPTASPSPPPRAQDARVGDAVVSDGPGGEPFEFAHLDEPVGPTSVADWAPPAPQPPPPPRPAPKTGPSPTLDPEDEDFDFWAVAESGHVADVAIPHDAAPASHIEADLGADPSPPGSAPDPAIAVRTVLQPPTPPADDDPFDLADLAEPHADESEQIQGAPFSPPAAYDWEAEPDLAADATRMFRSPPDLAAEAPASAAPSVSLRFDDGRTLALRGVVVVGRQPVRQHHAGHVDLVPCTDAERSVSKTHLAVGLAEDGTIWAEDLHSTNGTGIIAPDGNVTRLRPGVPTTVPPGCSVLFGRRRLEIRHGG